MAKQCIYCGHLLAKEDARFCNDCGQSQVPPSGAAAPSAIKVKLPPREFSRIDAAARPETGAPERETQAAPPSFEQASRMPKRPMRLTSSDSLAPVDRKEAPVEDPFAGPARPTAAGPTPAEEISTMVLPNWREELAQLRKDQEQSGKVAPAGSEKKAERASAEPPPLPRRSPSVPLAAREAGPARSSASSPPPAGQLSTLPGGGSVAGEKTRPVDAGRAMPETPQPREAVRPADFSRPAQNTPVPEAPFATEVARRELRVKMWEQEATIQYPQVHEEKQEPGPAPAIEQNPLASAAFGVDERERVEELETVIWQSAPTPFSVPVKSDQPSEPGVSRGAAQAEGPAEIKAPGREEARQSKPARPPFKGEEGKGPGELENDIEDLPTTPLAVPEMAKPAAQIKIERASTPAPRQWTQPPAEEVEDLPTRPLAASPAAPRGPQAPGQGGPGRSEQVPGSANPASQPGTYGPPPSRQPAAQGPANPASLPGMYGPAPAQNMETMVDPLAARGRSGPSNSQPGVAFNPPSLPPPTQGPVSMPGNTPPWAETRVPSSHPVSPLPDTPGQRPSQTPAGFPGQSPQRPPVFEGSLTPGSAPADVSKSDGVQEKKPPEKKHTVRMVAIILLLLVLMGGGAGVVTNLSYFSQFFQQAQASQPFWTYQNSALGISMDYIPQSRINVDQTHGMVKFADTSSTDTVILERTASKGQVSDFLQQQLTQLGVTASKPESPATFAGANWQVVQGTVVQSGATYTLELYATQHGSYFYLLEFQAPPNSFKTMEQLNFAHIRSSFQFL